MYDLIQPYSRCQVFKMSSVWMLEENMDYDMRWVGELALLILTRAIMTRNGRGRLMKTLVERNWIESAQGFFLGRLAKPPKWQTNPAWKC